MAVEIVECSTAGHYADAREVTRAYVKWLDIDLSYQDFDAEWAEFDTMYGPPGGCYLLAIADGELAGGVGLRDLGDGICEMKRLYVFETSQGRGVARTLCRALLSRARALGYQRMRLDTLSHMHAAQKLYRSLGFEEIGSYRYNPDPSTRYMEKRLERADDGD